jgi:type IV pilus assembly protein PilY1
VRLSAQQGLGDKCGRDDGDGDCREQWVAIFGGGYRANANPNDPTYVADPGSPSWSDKSKGIFMVSLDTGELIASVTFDAMDDSADGPGNMRYALPSTPAVLDYDFDGFADLVYIGDLGGQVWKWDLSNVGEASDADGLVNNWPARVFFRAYTTDTWSAGPSRYHSFFFPPSATFVKGDLVLAFGSGEREDLQHIGNAVATEDNNRFYIVRDEYPTGTYGTLEALYENHLTDVTSPIAFPDAAHSGFFIRADDGEKFVTEHLIYAGKVITTSYTPVSDAVDDPCHSGAGGRSFVHIFDLVSAEGFFLDAAAPMGVSRRISIGSGLSTTPQLSLSRAGRSRLFVKTSSGAITVMDPPAPTGPPVSVIYWRQVF